MRSSFRPPGRPPRSAARGPPSRAAFDRAAIPLRPRGAPIRDARSRLASPRSTAARSESRPGRLLRRPLEVPAVDEPLRWLPDLDAAPVPLLAVVGALEDPTADVALEHDLEVAESGVRVV